MQFAIGVIILECIFVKHSHGPLKVKLEQGNLVPIKLVPLVLKYKIFTQIKAISPVSSFMWP
jgi:hypothetical protein